jgi:hypothetical protein
METHNDLSIFIKKIEAKFEYSKSEKKSLAFKTNKSTMEVLTSYLELYNSKCVDVCEDICWNNQTFESYSPKTGIKTIIYTKE